MARGKAKGSEVGPIDKRDTYADERVVAVSLDGELRRVVDAYATDFRVTRGAGVRLLLMKGLAAEGRWPPRK